MTYSTTVVTELKFKSSYQSVCPHPGPILLTALQNVVLSVPFAFRVGLLL